MRFPVLLRSSASFYILALVGGVLLERFAGYLWYEQAIIKGQAANIIVAFASFAVASILWLILSGRESAKGPLLIFLVAMIVAWFTHLGLYRFHGDAFNYTALLYVPITLMLIFKPPTVDECRTAAIGFASGISLILMMTRVLEMINVLEVRRQQPGVIQFDEERYFLPLNQVLGIDGRWPGPFGHNGDTAMMGALLIVLAFAFWSRASWIFLIVGALTLVLTNGRASIGAALAGLILIAMWSKSNRLRAIPRGARIAVGSLVLLVGALYMFTRPAGLTGRDKIWPAFIDLWLESPWIGVGGRGIATGNEVAQAFGHAHSLYIDELARWGLAGFLTQFAALGFGLFIAARAAGLGLPGPLAVLVTYFITGITEPRNNWIAPSVTGFLVILMVLAAAAFLNQSGKKERLDHDEGREKSEPLTSTTGPDVKPGEASAKSSG